MKRSRFSEEQIIAILKEQETGSLSLICWPAPIWWPSSNLMHGGLGGHG